MNAVEAFQKVKSRNAKLMVKGQGPELEALTKEIKGKNRMYLYNNPECPVDDYSMINACDMLVVPSISDEDFPNVILIAQMYGKLVIGTNLAGIPEMLKAVSGCLVESGDIDGLARAIQGYSSTYGPRVISSALAKMRYPRVYSREKSIKKYLKLWGV